MPMLAVAVSLTKSLGADDSDTGVRIDRSRRSISQEGPMSIMNLGILISEDSYEDMRKVRGFFCGD